MIKIPQLNPIREESRVISVFGGINRTPNINEGNTSRSTTYPLEFENDLNLCADDYPAIRTRDKRFRYHPMGYVGVKSWETYIALLKSSTIRILWKDAQENKRYYYKVGYCYSTTEDFTLGFNRYDLIIGYLGTTDEDQEVTEEQLASAPPIFAYPCNSEGLINSIFGGFTERKDNDIICIKSSDNWTLNGMNLVKDKYYVVTLLDKANNKIAIREWGDQFDKSMTNVKLYYNNELIRLIPRYFGYDATGKEVYGCDRLIFGAKEVPIWEENNCSCFGKLKDYYKRNNVNDISIASIGAYVLFMPYKSWLNTESGAITSMEYGVTCGMSEYSGRYNKDHTTVYKGLSMDLYWRNDNNNPILVAGKTYDATSTVNNILYVKASGNSYWRYTGSKFEEVESILIGLNYTAANGLENLINAQPGDMVSISDLTYYTGYKKSSSKWTNPFKDSKINGTYEIVTNTNEGHPGWYTLTFEVNIKECSDFIQNAFKTTVANGVLRGQYSSISIGNSIPDMRYICASNNRIWGCDHTGHELYASALGSVRNWDLSQDSMTSMAAYTASVGEGKNWTGCISYDGYPYFFKKDRVFRVSGTRPANFSYAETQMPGCTDAESLAIVNGILFYMGQDGVYAYTGGMPSLVSKNLDGKWIMGNGCGYGNKYYLSRKKDMKGFVVDRSFNEDDPDGLNDKWELLVYDTQTNTWHSEGDKRWSDIQSTPDTMYYVENIKGIHYLCTINKTYWAGAYREEDDFDWFFETGNWHTYDGAKNYLKNLIIHAEFKGTLDVYVQYENSGDWILYKTFDSEERKDLDVKFAPRRAEYFKLKISGHGTCMIYDIHEIYEIAKELTKG